MGRGLVRPTKPTMNITGRLESTSIAFLKRKMLDFLLRAKRDIAAAKVFFQRAFRGQGSIRLIRSRRRLSSSSHRAAKEAPGEHPAGIQCDLWSSMYV